MNYPKPYIQFLVHFHGDRDYFECHEVLEEYWKRNEANERKSVWVGLIQIAVSQYHYRRGNVTGAKKTMDKAVNILSLYQTRLDKLGINYPLLIELLTNIRSRMDDNKPYKSINLPIKDNKLLTECKVLCEINGFRWCSASDLSDEYLIHRHKMRDRSEVIRTRQQSLLFKRKSRIENKE